MKKCISIILVLITFSAQAQQLRSVFLRNISWTDAIKVLTPTAVVVIPLGAGAKEHGPHLPLSTDLIQAEYFINELAKRDSVVIAPTITYSYYPPFLSYAGSTSLRYSTSRDMILEIVRSLAAYGPRRFYIINVGITTLVPLRQAAGILKQDGIILTYSDDNRPSYEEKEKLIKKQATGTHADEIETSHILWMSPKLVDMTLALDDTMAKTRTGPILSPVKKVNTTYSPSGIYGYATLATREKGHLSSELILSGIMTDIDSIRHCSLPPVPDHSIEYQAYCGSYLYDNDKHLVISFANNALQYVLNGRSFVGIYQLMPYDKDHFCSQQIDLLFLHGDNDQVGKIYFTGPDGQFWAIREK